MYYLIGLAGEGNALAQATIEKVDKFISLGACPWAELLDLELEDARQAIVPVVNSYRASPYNYLYGEGFNI